MGHGGDPGVATFLQPSTGWACPTRTTGVVHPWTAIAVRVTLNHEAEMTADSAEVERPQRGSALATVACPAPRITALTLRTGTENDAHLRLAESVTTVHSRSPELPQRTPLDELREARGRPNRMSHTERRDTDRP